MTPMMHCKKGVLTGKKAVAIILLIVGVMLMFFIISQGIGIYKDSREASDRQGLSSVQCFGFLYTVKGITATDEELQFEFRNELSSTEEVHNLTIMGAGTGAGQSRSSVDVSIPTGSSLAIRAPVRVEDNFTVYPDNCQLYPLRCSLEGKCSYS
ncbi:hypothetical protein HYV85_00520 [Candidatus Woesearchaeota archaeon]|nr:hypothetical protein [Candidatus Woesearchaeota archaeon]